MQRLAGNKLRLDIWQVGVCGKYCRIQQHYKHCEKLHTPHDRNNGETGGAKRLCFYIRIRLPFMDVPEVKYSVCIYKQASLTLTTMTLFLTRHIGIESLCTAQAIIHETDKICLPTPKDAQGNSTALCDFYGC